MEGVLLGERLHRRRPHGHQERGHLIREHLGRRRRRHFQGRDRRAGQALGGTQALLRSDHDRVQSPALRLPGRAHRYSPGTREGAVKYTDFAIGPVHRPRARHALVRDTLFAIVARPHAQRARPHRAAPENYHIPFVVYSPGHVPPGRIDTVASQIDVGPTLLGVLDFSYRSRFFGHDILRDGAKHPRAPFRQLPDRGLLPRRRRRRARSPRGATASWTQAPDWRSRRGRALARVCWKRRSATTSLRAARTGPASSSSRARLSSEQRPLFRRRFS